MNIQAFDFKADILPYINGHTFILLIGALIAVIYFSVLLIRIKKAESIPATKRCYTPPKDMPPELVGLLYNKGVSIFSFYLFTACIIRLGNVGLIKIFADKARKVIVGRKFDIYHVDATSNEPLGIGTHYIHNTLFRVMENPNKFVRDIDLDVWYSPKFVSIVATYIQLLKSSYYPIFLNQNTGHSVTMVILSVLTVALYILSFSTGSAYLLITPIILSFGLGGLALYSLGDYLKKWIVDKSLHIKKTLVILLITSILSLGAGVYAGLMLGSEIFCLVDILLIALLFILPVVSFIAFKTYTDEGLKYLADIKGFANFIKGKDTEGNPILANLNYTPELYTNMMPFALAMGIPSVWAGHFSSHVSESMFADIGYDWLTSEAKTDVMGHELTRALEDLVETFEYSNMAPSRHRNRYY